MISYNDVARPLFGAEAFALQGIHASMLPIDIRFLKHAFDDRFLRHAAGNAFNCPQSQMGIVISLCVFELPRTNNEVEARRARARLIRHTAG